MLPQTNDLWSCANLIILASVALIPKFLSWTLSSLTKAINVSGLCLANIIKSLFISEEVILPTTDPASTLNTASAWSISSPFAKFKASSSSSISNNSSLASATGSNSSYTTSLPGW